MNAAARISEIRSNNPAIDWARVDRLHAEMWPELLHVQHVQPIAIVKPRTAEVATRHLPKHDPNEKRAYDATNRDYGTGTCETCGKPFQRPAFNTLNCSAVCIRARKNRAKVDYRLSLKAKKAATP